MLFTFFWIMLTTKNLSNMYEKVIIVHFMFLCILVNAEFPESIEVFNPAEPPQVDIAENINHTVYNNGTLEVNSTLEGKANDTKKLVSCKDIVYNTTEEFDVTVELVNSTKLMKLLTNDPEVTSRDMKADCIIILFHATTCPFSCQAAPHYNALARSYPNIKFVAIDAIKYHSSNAHFGVVGIPTIKLFHNGRPVGRYNGTEYNIKPFSEFISSLTGQKPKELLVLSKDFHGPVPSVLQQEIDYFLILAWLFILICGVYFFSKSAWWEGIVDLIQSTWRESEAHHDHLD